MNELSIKMKQAAAVLSVESERKQQRANKAVTSLMALAYIVVGYFE